jgi:hypothetical protein
MLERASGFREDVVDGRYAIETRHRGLDWEVMSNPTKWRILWLSSRPPRSARSTMLMRYRSLEVTFRNGKPLAAYLYLPRGDRAAVASTRDAGAGMKVDFDASGTPIGVEITAPSIVSVERLNAVLKGCGADVIDAHELAPLAA